MLPHVGIERPAMDQNHRLAGPPVVVEQVGAVGGLDEGHAEVSVVSGRNPGRRLLFRCHAGRFREYALILSQVVPRRLSLFQIWATPTEIVEATETETSTR